MPVETIEAMSTALKPYASCVCMPMHNNRQPVCQTVVQQVSVVDELEKFKSLLDSGVVTQKEFDAKKKQLLGW